MSNLLVCMHALLMSVCSSFMLVYKYLVYEKQDVSCKISCFVLCNLIMVNMCYKLLEKGYAHTR
jgi:hypothetical protein